MADAMAAPADEPNRAPYILCAGLLVVLAGQAVYYYPQLPERMASHFGSDGQPNGWSSREGFFGIIGFVVLIESAAFLGLPRILGRFPIALINLPNKQYWLVPERKQESLAWMTQRMAWFGAAILALIAVVNQMVIQANLSSEARLSDRMWIVIAVFLVFVAGWMAAIFRRFRLPSC
ncbi:MAG: DUF1648 domain-containing protein [Terriglobales bacterium]